MAIPIRQNSFYSMAFEGDILIIAAPGFGEIRFNTAAGAHSAEVDGSARRLGYKEKLCNGAAKGQTSSKAEKWAGIKRVEANLNANLWREPTASRAPAPVDAILLVHAINEARGKVEPKVVKMVAEATEAKRLSWRIDPIIAPIYERMLTKLLGAGAPENGLAEFDALEEPALEEPAFSAEDLEEAAALIRTE